MELKISKFDYFGRGIGRINDKVVFVSKALPNEIINIKLIKEKSKFSEGIVSNIIKSSNNRIEVICPYYNKCGGCTFLHTTYDVEKDFKINKAIELLGRCDNFYETNNLNYRNKVTLHVKDNKIGYYEEKSNSLVEIKYCYLLNDNINKVIDDLVNFNLNKVNKIIIKTHKNKILVNFFGEINKDIINKLSYVDTIISDNKIVKGNGYLEEVINGKKFKITSEAFFQVNNEELLNKLNIINNFLNNKKINNVLDLYSGISLWGILISDKVSNVTSIEINKEACQNAKDGLIKNNITNVTVINGDVKDYIDKFKDIDLVLIDPPRSGLDKKTRDYLKIINSQYIIYISCDMISLKRDLEELKELYIIKEIDLVDMFKRTYHVESVCLLSRKSVDR